MSDGCQHKYQDEAVNGEYTCGDPVVADTDRCHQHRRRATTVTLPMSPEFIAAVEESKARVAALPPIDADLKAKYDEELDRAMLDGAS